MPFPHLSDRSRFPAFLELPVANESGLPERERHGSSVPTDAQQDAQQQQQQHYLLAQVQNNMTITKPTLVLTDRDGTGFALVFDGLARDELDLAGLGLKKGATVVVRGALRTTTATTSAAAPASSEETAPADGTAVVSPEAMTAKAARRPFVRIPTGQAGSVMAVPAPLDKVLALAARSALQKQHGSRCDVCGLTAEAAPSTVKLRKCTGCGQVAYCSKTKGWTDGHKAECKTMRAMSAIWGC